MSRTGRRCGWRCSGRCGWSVDGAPVEVPGPKRRAVLALLALAEGRTVPVDDLVDALWPSDAAGVRPPGPAHPRLPAARATSARPAARLQTRPRRLPAALGPTLDVAQARPLLAAPAHGSGRRAATAASRRTRCGAGRCWPTSPTSRRSPSRSRAARSLHREVTDALVAAAVAAGRAGDVVGLAAAAHAADPLREPAVLAADARARGDRAGTRRRCGSGGSTGAGSPRRPASTRRRRSASSSATSPERDAAAPAAADPADDAARRPRAAGRGAAPAARRGAAGHGRRAGRGRQDPGRAGGRARGPTRRPCCCSRRSPTRPRSRTRWPRRWTSTSSRATSWPPASALLGDRPGLLVVDNCEHLLDAARDVVGTLLAACPRLSRAGDEPRAARPVRRVRLPAGAARAAAPPGRTPAQVAVGGGVPRPGPPGAPRRGAHARGPATWSPTSSAASTGCRWPSSSPPAGCRRSPSPTCTAGSTARSTCSAAGPAARPGTGRCAPPSSGPTSCSATTSGGCSGTCRCSSTASTSTPPSGSPPTWSLAGDPGTVLSRLVDASMMEAVEFRYGPAPGTGCWRRCARSGSTGSPPTGEDGDAGDRLLRLGGRAHRAGSGAALLDRARARGRRRAAPRAGEPAGRVAAGPRRAGSSTPPPRSSSRLFDAIAYRDLVEIRGWAEELAADSGARGASRARPRVLGTAAEAAYHRGDHATRRAARPGRAGARHRRRRPGGTAWCRWRWSPWPAGQYAEVVEHCLAAATRDPGAARTLGIAALATAYAGDLDRARDAARAGPRRTRSRRRCARGAPTSPGRSRASPGTPRRPSGSYRAAIDLARRSGATFLVGVATVGLLTVLADAGRVARRAARLPRRRRLLRPHRQLDAPVADAAQPRRPAAPHRRPRPGGGPRRGRRPGPGRPRRQPDGCPARPVSATDGPEPARTSSPSPGSAIERNVSRGWRADQRPGRA